MEKLGLFKDLEIRQSDLIGIYGGTNSWCEEMTCTEKDGCSDTESWLYDESGALVCHRITVDCCDPVT